MILKWINRGNTFKINTAHDGEIVTCPIYEADYWVIVKDEKVQLKRIRSLRRRLRSTSILKQALTVMAQIRNWEYTVIPVKTRIHSKHFEGRT